MLFLDEPTDGLDPVSSKAIRTLIQEEAGRGAAVLLTTHDMGEADELSNRVAFINEGRLHAVDTPENLKLSYGKRAVKVRARQGGEIVENSVALDAEDAGEQLKIAVATEGLLTIHTEEATLENIFIQMTGRGLKECVVPFARSADDRAGPGLMPHRLSSGRRMGPELMARPGLHRWAGGGHRAQGSARVRRGTACG